MPTDHSRYTAAELGLIEAGIASGETMIFLGYDADEMARFYCVEAMW